MGQAFAKGLARMKEHAITITDTNLEKIGFLKDEGVRVNVDNISAVSDAEIVIIAVKPQVTQTALSELKGALNTQLLVSVAAGISTAQLAEWSGLHRIVRVMPNTPALIAQGASGFFAVSDVSAEDRELIESLLSAVGEAIEVSSEEDIDSITALSGSGPAYVFYFLEAMVQAGTSMGLSKDHAKKLALQTFIGASELAKNSNDDLELLREKVTSKGGTTEAALEVLNDLQVKESFVKAIQRAKERAEELRS